MVMSLCRDGVMVRLQTRLLLDEKKPCLECKEVLFAMQRSLVFETGRKSVGRCKVGVIGS